MYENKSVASMRVGSGSLSISIASPEDILSWSCGEVVSSDSINYRTYNTEKGGLFCARIFGPTRDYECQCGKYRRIKYKGITCEKCGVEVTLSRVRRERMGHIDLVTPVAHILFLRGTTSIISSVLGIPLKDIERVLYFEAYIVTDPGSTVLSKREILSETSYHAAIEQFGDAFVAESGAAGIRTILVDMNLEQELNKVHAQIAVVKADLKRRTLLKRSKIITDFIKSGNRPEWMILTRVPVIPPDIRPLVPLDGGRFVSSDLNDLYRRVINRNNRLRRMMACSAPDIIIRNEKRMLQEAVDALFDNSKRAVVAKSATGRPLKSLSDSLKGKQGRFRQNLLGKRVDYSGRSVIIVGPTMKLHQCGLPKQMALELFRPFLFAKLIMFGKASSIKSAKRIVDLEQPEVWEILEDVVREHVVMLNRAPTLHRLSIQAFEPKLLESKAIQLHPLVCKAFNADFDGDQMAVHLPLSIEAQAECRILMMSTNNILSPQSGKPIISPTKDIAVGLYYMTCAMTDSKGRGTVFTDYDEIIMALDAGIVAINTSIKYYHSYFEHEDADIKEKMIPSETTPGRVMIYNILPKDGKIPFETINTTINSKTVANILDAVYRIYGQKYAVLFADHITAFGFRYATLSGLSFGKDDMTVPESKAMHIENTNKKIEISQSQYDAGYITARERYNQVTDYWSDCANKVSEDVIIELSKNSDNSKINSIYIMMNSGARASEALMRQLAGMRGLIAKPSGEIIESPIISSFKEGLNVLEYFNSTHGARKGAADTALKTADAGYLTRRLVDVAQDCVITMQDCGTSDGIEYTAKVEDDVIVDSMQSMVFGRVVASDVLDINNNVVIHAGELLIDSNMHTLNEFVPSIFVRSPVLCRATEGICAKCYGMDLAAGRLVDVGEVVGIIAAQSIGEPGAQLTMQTFHIGGTASKSIERSNVTSMYNGVVKFVNVNTITNSTGSNLLVSNTGDIEIYSESGEIRRSLYSVPYGAKIHVSDGQTIERGTQMATWDPYNVHIIAEYKGRIKFDDMVSGVSYRNKIDESIGMAYKVIINSTKVTKILSPKILLVDENGQYLRRANGDLVRYFLPINSIISLQDGDLVNPGDNIARIPIDNAHSIKDITGGLPRVEEIFEARVPKYPAVVADIDGIVKFDDSFKLKTHITIVSQDNPDVTVSYNIPRGRYIKVQDSSFVRKGDIIVDGKLDPHDILDVSGIKGITKSIIEEVRHVYRLQGVEIDNKHIEIIVRYMLQKIEITDPKDSDMYVGQQVDINLLYNINDCLVADGKNPAEFKRILQGITRASIQTSSFISAASFQETTRVLAEAAVAGKSDNLTGMKESIIVGRLIPAGTGYIINELRNRAKNEMMNHNTEETVE